MRIGTPFADVIAHCGGFASEEGERKIIMGGPMMGLAQYSLEVPVVKGTSGILVMQGSVRAGRETPCIKCGRCVAICPMYLMPNRISDYAELDKFDQCNEYGVKDCIECGACAYVCDVQAADRAPREVREAQPREEETGGDERRPRGGKAMSATTVVSVSPHLRDRDDTARVMWTVFVALVPALAAATYLFGWRALLLAAVAVAVSVATEVLSQLVFKREVSVSDGSAAVTGLLLAFTCPPQTPLWMVALGAFAAIFIVKQLFGGVGYNIFNPALAARALMLASFPVAMTLWAAPVRSLAFGGVDATAAASALGIVKEAAKSGTAAAMPYGYLDLLLGNIPGSLGETCKIALLLGAAFLFVRKIIDWRIPVTFLGSVALLSWIVGRDPLFELLSGGLILGAFFMATDYVTSPTTNNGRLIFGLGAGLITFLIRNYGGFPEGVCYAILFMNVCSPLIESYVRPRRFGVTRARKAGAR